MRTLLTIILICFLSSNILGQIKTIHVFVALCDNQYQGIVPVPSKLGNGKDPRNNLYWGAAYGVKSYLKYKTDDWKLVKSYKSENPIILERVLFKHATQEIFILADAYDGEKIKDCTIDFIKAANNQNPLKISYDSLNLSFGGNADLVAYAGHDGLMDFNIDIDYKTDIKNETDIIILACYSKHYFSPKIRISKANPILWTTHLMAPEAYTLKAAIDGWILNESGIEIEERAAQSYNKYQKCGIKGARNLFTSGF
ncbi:MAG: hypothetical protein HQ521_00010 [Bacteroidetes bacterium]|nr:hypothetical protein [Bacteroidota bacterium]